MKQFIYDIAQTSLADDEGNVTITRDIRPDIFRADEHELNIEALTTTAGSFSVDYIPYGSTNSVSLIDEFGAVLVLDATNLYPITFKCSVEEIKIKPTGLNGTWGYSLVGKA